MKEPRQMLEIFARSGEAAGSGDDRAHPWIELLRAGTRLLARDE
jgi:hypothetical protein